MTTVQIGFYHSLSSPFGAGYLLKTEVRVPDTTNVLFWYKRYQGMSRKLDALYMRPIANMGRISKLLHRTWLALLLWERNRLRAEFMLAARDSILEATYRGTLRQYVDASFNTPPDESWIAVTETEGKRLAANLQDTKKESWAFAAQ